MKKVTMLFTFLITLALSAVVIVFFDSERIKVDAIPKELYQVYLGGEKVGVIRSKTKLEAYINEQQKAIKDKYDVKNVYPPKDLNIQKYVSYGERILSEKEVYNLIKEKNPFTIKGYTIKIKTNPERVINVLDKEVFEKAMTKTVEAFVPAENYDAFIKDKQPEIEGTGKLIEDLYIKENITIKEDYISTGEDIYTDVNTLAKYLLFGTTAEQEKYTVKAGETIENIAFNHQLGVNEFLIVNPEFSKANSLLYPGQEVSVGLIQPIVNVVVEEHVVEDQVIKYETETQYDSNVAYGTTIVKQEGADGLQRVVIKKQTTNGVITNLQIDRSSINVIKDAVKRIVVKGSRNSSGTITISPDGNWVWPTNQGYEITTYFGYRWRQAHFAIDIAGTGYGSPIRAARAGVIFTSGYDATRGNYLVLQHDSNYYTIYLHLSKKYVVEGQAVAAGQVIAAMGNSGYVVGTTGVHLHFGIFIGEPYKTGSTPLDPLKFYR